MPRVIVARPPSTNQNIPMCLLERGLMAGRKGLMSSSLFDNTIHYYYYQNQNQSINFICEG